MERFTDSFDSDDEFNDADEKMMADIAQSNKNQEEHIKLVGKQMKHDLLDKAIFISKGNWFWGLLPQSLRLFNIAKTFETLQKLVD